MPPIRRTLLLKRVVQIDGKVRPAIPALALHESMADVFNKANTVWDRHYPAKEKVIPGKRCVFLERRDRSDGGIAVLFNAYVYSAGHTPDQVVFDDVKARISAEPILSEDGSHKEIVERFTCIVVGETLVMESAQVSNSGKLAVIAMRDLIRRHVAPRFPTLDLEDAPSLEFKQMARLHGGVQSVTARLQSGFVTEPSTFGQSMETLVKATKLGPVRRLTTTIEAPQEGDGLDVDEVERMLNESEHGTGLSGITVTFKDGPTLGELSKYREKMSIEVQQVRAGVPAVTEIETAIVNYLRKLATPTDDDFQLISNTGMFTQ